MSRMIVLVVSAAVGAIVMLGVGNDLRGGFGEGASNTGISQARCVRQFDGLDVSQQTAEDICGCMLTEFDKRGIAVLDALAGRAEEMQAITRRCALDHGYTIGG